MNIKFSKYQGAGNDFILIDNRNKSFEWSEHSIRLLANRKFGIGSDGVMLLEKDDECDFYMRFFNPDATQEGMCGNGSRCIALFARHLGINSDFLTFRTIDGIHHIQFVEYNQNRAILKVKLIDINHIESTNEYLFMNTGVNHHLQFVDNVDKVDIIAQGSKIRYSKQYESIGGTNANFIEILQNGGIKLRTYERGVEDETLACGTGATASAIAYAIKESKPSPVTVHAKGGVLKIYFTIIDNNSVQDVYLEGEAKFVFKGEIEI